MADVRLKIAPPWVTYVNQMIALVGEDSEVDVDYDNAARALTLRVSKDRKASAIARLLPCVKEYGNEALTVTVVPPNGGDLTDYEWHSNKELFDAAFENNPVYCTSVRIDTIFSNDITYVVFKNKVVQFFNDNLNDLHGNVSKEISVKNFKKIFDLEKAKPLLKYKMTKYGSNIVTDMPFFTKAVYLKFGERIGWNDTY